jgi:hypothetical protein
MATFLRKVFHVRKDKRNGGQGHQTIKLTGTQYGLGIKIIGGRSTTGLNFGIFIRAMTEEGAATRDG